MWLVLQLVGAGDSFRNTASPLPSAIPGHPGDSQGVTETGTRSHGALLLAPREDRRARPWVSMCRGPLVSSDPWTHMVPLPGGPPGIPYASLNQPTPLFANDYFYWTQVSLGFLYFIQHLFPMCREGRMHRKEVAHPQEAHTRHLAELSRAANDVVGGGEPSLGSIPLLPHN